MRSETSDPAAVEVEDLMIADEGTAAQPTTLWTDGPRCFQKVDSTGLGVMRTGAPWSENANEILAEWAGGAVKSAIEAGTYGFKIEINSMTKIVLSRKVMTFEEAWKAALQESTEPINCYGVLKLSGCTCKETIQEKLVVTVVKDMFFCPKECGALNTIDTTKIHKDATFTTVWRLKGTSFFPCAIALVTLKTLQFKPGKTLQLH